MLHHAIALWMLLLSLSLPARGVEIIACGGSQVVIFDADQPAGENPKLKWSWDVKEATNLPPRYDAQTQHLVYTKAEISWWTHHVYCLNPTKTFTFPGINLYKARVSSP